MNQEGKGSAAGGLVSENPRISRVKMAFKAFLLVLFVVGGVWLVYGTPLKHYLHEVGEVKDTLQRTGAAAPFIFVLVSAVLIAVGLPRLIICPIGGAVFGFIWGLLLTQTATLLGSYSTFLFVRWGGRDFVVRHWPRLLSMTSVFERRGFLAVFLARQLPLGGVFVNMLLAMTPVRHGAFLLGTIVGILPEAVPATLMGSGAAEIVAGESIWRTLVGAGLLLTVWIIFAEYVRRSKAAASFLSRTREVLGKKGKETSK